MKRQIITAVILILTNTAVNLEIQAANIEMDVDNGVNVEEEAVNIEMDVVNGVNVEEEAVNSEMDVDNSVNVVEEAVNREMDGTISENKGLADVIIEESEIMSSADSIPLAVLTVRPGEEIEPKAVLQLVHGMCEHKERYLPFMEYMAREGYICVMHDHRGHGASVKDSADLGYFYEGGYDAMIEDVKIVRNTFESANPKLKTILFGHSMGSMVVRSYVKRYDEDIQGLIVCGTPSYDPMSKLGVKIARKSIKKHGGMYRPELIQKLSFNSFNKRFKKEGSPNAWICSDPIVVARYDNDPLCNYQFTSNGFYNLFSLMQYTFDEEEWVMNHPQLPIMFISGEDDPCRVNHKKFTETVEFMRGVGYEDVRSRVYPDMRHEILNEIGKEKVWEDILEFCNESIASQGDK